MSGRSASSSAQSVGSAVLAASTSNDAPAVYLDLGDVSFASAAISGLTTMRIGRVVADVCKPGDET
jgi:hypothetical protein